MASSQRTRAATESLTFLGITIAALVLLNIIVWMVPPVRLDWTKDDLFSLSDGSRDLAGGLTDRLEIDAYFTEDLPPPFNATETYVRDILSEYVSASNGKIVITYVNPDTEDEKEQAQEAGIQPVSHQAIKDDSIQVIEGYRGLVMRYLDRVETIPVIQDTTGLEYAITMKIKKLVGERRPIGLLGGHEGPTLTEGLGRLRTCAPMYEFREVQASAEIDDELATLIIAEPGTPLSDTELRRIDQYVMNGGSLGVFGGSMKIALEGAEPAATPVESNINTLLRAWGVVVEQGIVHDAQCGRAPYRVSMGGQQAMIPVPHPPVPIVGFDEAGADHPVLFRLESAPMPFISPLDLTENADHATILARSSEQSWLVESASVSLMPRDPRTWTQDGESGPFPLIAAIEGELPSAFAGQSGEGEDIDAPARSRAAVHVLVVGGSFFLRDEALPQQDEAGECQMSSNLALALNALDWLTQDSDLIAIRAKVVEDPVIEVPHDVRQAEDEARTATTEAIEAAQEGDEAGVEEHVSAREEALERRKAAMEQWETRKRLYRFGNMLGLPAAFALFGVFRWRYRQSKRKNVSI
jgi:gliding-associated putative ABC transporter substrate-binding component GldG